MGIDEEEDEEASQKSDCTFVASLDDWIDHQIEIHVNEEHDGEVHDTESDSESVKERDRAKKKMRTVARMREQPKRSKLGHATPILQALVRTRRGSPAPRWG